MVRYIEETHAEFQNGSIVLRKVLIPVYVPDDQERGQEQTDWRSEIIQIWGDPTD